MKAHFGSLVQGPVERYEARNVLALKFVMHDALVAVALALCVPTTWARRWAPLLLRMVIDVPDSVAAGARRAKAPIDRS